MAKPPDFAHVSEATQPARFASRRKLTLHVVKHLIEGRDERWHQIVGAELLAKARDEDRLGSPGPAFREISRAYERYVSDQLLKACAQGKGHHHKYRYWVDLDDLSEIVAAVRIEGWSMSEKLVFCAESPVSEGHFGAYHLLTALRPWPNLSPAATARKAREWFRNRRTAALYRVLAVHDS